MTNGMDVQVLRGSATCKTWELGIKSGARRKKEENNVSSMSKS